MIACMTKNRVIGMNNKLPWKQRNDMQRFKGLTWGHEVLMGRKTWDSFGGKVLPGRFNKIASRDGSWYPEGFTDDRHDVIRDPEEYLQFCEFYGNEVFIIGGEQLYTLGMDFADRIFLTVLDVEILGDAFFPEIDETKWKKIAEEKYSADETNQYGYNFLTFVRQ
jgi:dihydrofolate reductase